MDFQTFTVGESKPLPEGLWHENHTAKAIYKECGEFCKAQPEEERFQFQIDFDPKDGRKVSLTRIK
jgi:hypothetical protein